MAVISISNVSLSFGSNIIFDDLSFQIHQGDHIGLVGSNGRGKTTLFKIITGELKPESGTVDYSKHTVIGYLPQEKTFDEEIALMDYIHSVTGNKKDLEKNISELEDKISATGSPDEKLELSHDLAELHERLVYFESFYSAHEAEMLLQGLGFKRTDFSRSMTEFSGGWQMRAHLAALLFLKPDLLLLDEPTNYLDLPSLGWLDKYLDSYRKAFIVISHDRFFLDRHVKRIIALEPEGVRFYKGNYSASRKLRAEEERILENKKKNTERERKQLERFIERFKAKSTKARQASSKAKLLKKLDRVEELKEERKFEFSFPPSERSGDRVVVLDNLAMSFGDLHLYKDISAVITRGEKIGIVGVNGSGKTTLLKLLAGELKPVAGEIKYGSGVKFSYYAQHQTESLDLRNTVIEEVRQTAPQLGETRIRNILGAFLFKGDDADKAVGVLSGGEKARVALAKLLVAPGNLLLMDEPTNHLDLESSESLAEALSRYDGTLIFVSHNHAFIDRLATKIWEVENGKIHVYPGNLSEYLEHLENKKEGGKLFTSSDLGDSASSKSNIRNNDKKETAESKRENKAEKRRREARLRQLLQKELGPVRKKIKEIESRISKLEEEQSILEKNMADPNLYGKPEFVNSLKKFKENEKKINELMDRWSYNSEILEKREQEITLNFK